MSWVGRSDYGGREMPPNQRPHLTDLHMCRDSIMYATLMHIYMYSVHVRGPRVGQCVYMPLYKYMYMYMYTVNGKVQLIMKFITVDSVKDLSLIHI